MKLSEQQRAFTRDIGLLIAYAYANGFELAFGEVERPLEMQKIYFNSGRSKTMDSRHLQRLAADFAIYYDGVLLFAPGISDAQYMHDLGICRALGKYWMGLNPLNVWGGDWNRNNVYDEKFRDPYHFERKPIKQ